MKVIDCLIDKPKVILRPTDLDKDFVPMLQVDIRSGEVVLNRLNDLYMPANTPASGGAK
jgi:hypothetical protein